MSRPAIPTEIKRRILIESGYRCAVPTCRFPVTENAHITSWVETKDHSYENLIALCPNCHTLYDTGKISKEAIIAYKKKLIFLNDVYSRFEIDVLDHLKFHKRALIAGELSIKRILEEQIVEKEKVHAWQSYDDGDRIDIFFSVKLSTKGRALLDNWSKIDQTLTHESL
jgi:hypothetical protein